MLREMGRAPPDYESEIKGNRHLRSVCDAQRIGLASALPMRVEVPMRSDFWVHTLIFVGLALAIIHYRNSQSPAVHKERASAPAVKSLTKSSLSQDPLRPSLGSIGTIGYLPTRREIRPTPKLPASAANSINSQSRLNGPYYMVTTDNTDLHFQNASDRQRTLCKSSHQNYWLCQNLTPETSPGSERPELSIYCEDCNGNSLSELHANDLGSNTWN